MSGPFFCPAGAPVVIEAVSEASESGGDNDQRWR